VNSNWPFSKNARAFVPLVVVVAGLIMTPSALAYIGPGAGVSAIGTVLALVLGLLLAIVGFVWYPLKRRLKNRSRE